MVIMKGFYRETIEANTYNYKKNQHDIFLLFSYSKNKMFWAILSFWEISFYRLRAKHMI